MPVIKLTLIGDIPVWPELQNLGEHLIIDCTGPAAPAIQIALAYGGMVSGADSVLIRVDLPDGRVFVTETSAKMFLTAADAIRAVSSYASG